MARWRLESTRETRKKIEDLREKESVDWDELSDEQIDLLLESGFFSQRTRYSDARSLEDIESIDEQLREDMDDTLAERDFEDVELEELRAALESVPEDLDDEIATSRTFSNERYTGLEGNLEGYGSHTIEEGRFGFDGQLQEENSQQTVGQQQPDFGDVIDEGDDLFDAIISGMSGEDFDRAEAILAAEAVELEEDIEAEENLEPEGEIEDEEDIEPERETEVEENIEIDEEVVVDEKLQEEVEEISLQRAELEREKEEERLKKEAEEKARREAEQERLRLEAEKKEKERQEQIAFMEQIRRKEEERIAKEEERKNNPYMAIAEDMELLDTITDEAERRRIQEFICQEALIGVFRENENREGVLNRKDRDVRFSQSRTFFVDRQSTAFYEKLKAAGSYDKETILKIMRETIIDDEIKCSRTTDEILMNTNPFLEGLTADDRLYIAEHYDITRNGDVESQVRAGGQQKVIVENGDKFEGFIAYEPTVVEPEIKEAEIQEAVTEGSTISQPEVRTTRLAAYDIDEIDDSEMENIQGGVERRAKDIAQQQINDEFRKAILRKRESRRITPDELDIEEMENLQAGVYQKQKDINEEMANEYRSQYKNKDLETTAVVKDVPQKENWIERFKFWYNQGKQLPNQERHSTMKNIMNAIRESIRLNRNRRDIDNKRER